MIAVFAEFSKGSGEQSFAVTEDASEHQHRTRADHEEKGRESAERYEPAVYNKNRGQKNDQENKTETEPTAPSKLKSRCVLNFSRSS